MPLEFSGFEVNAGLPMLSGTLTWAKTPGDEVLARQVIIFLEDRRLLFGDRHVEDELHCLRSAFEIRKFLSENIATAHQGKELEQSLRAMRAACRRFIEASGPDGVHFIHRAQAYEADPFSLALGDLRTLIGTQAALLARVYQLPVEPDLARIFPPIDDDQEQELSWVPGFD